MTQCGELPNGLLFGRPTYSARMLLTFCGCQRPVRAGKALRASVWLLRRPSQGDRGVMRAACRVTR
jgi:acyl dehydratase